MRMRETTPRSTSTRLVLTTCLVEERVGPQRKRVAGEDSEGERTRSSGEDDSMPELIGHRPGEEPTLDADMHLRSSVASRIRIR